MRTTKYAKWVERFLMAIMAVIIAVGAGISYGADRSITKWSSTCSGARNSAINYAKADCRDENKNYKSVSMSRCSSVLGYKVRTHVYRCDAKSSGYNIPSVSGNACAVGDALDRAEYAGELQCNGQFEYSPNQIAIRRGACTGSCAHESFDQCSSHLGQRETVTIINGFCRTN